MNSVRAIEAEVSIKSGVQAECTIGREVIVEVHDYANIESLAVTENGIYTPTDGIDGFNPVTVNVEAPKDPNVVEGEFIGTETGVLTIDLPYVGDSYPKAIIIYDSEGIHKDEPHRAYTITAYCALKNNAQEPTYVDNTASDGFRYQVIYTGTTTYTSSGSALPNFFSQAEPTMGATTSVKMPDSKTLKVYVTNSMTTSATRFRVGIRYKYKVFY